MVKIFLIAAAIAIGACAYDASFTDCAVRCAADDQCPEGLACGAEGLCRIPGEIESCSAVLGTNPSCAGLPATCGPSGDEDCCSTAMPIPGGMYYRSYDVAVDGMYASQAYPATVRAFVLDKYEVTVGRFRKFVEAGMGTQLMPPLPGSGGRALNGEPAQGGWTSAININLAANTQALVAALNCDSTHQSWTNTQGANESLPINCVTWFEAFAFCVWDQGFLPTEAEWNFAASGGAEQRAYPWSSPASTTTINCERANYNINYPSGPFCMNGTVGAVNQVGSESPIGDGRWGHADLGGNANEWTLDNDAAYGSACDDCAALTSGDRIVRGSDWANASSTLRTGFRNHTYPDNRDSKLGFRCARRAQ